MDISILINTFIVFLKNHQSLAYLFLFLGSFFDIFIFTSFLLFGEVFFISGGILAGLGILNIWIVGLVCIGAGILGDMTNYYLGRNYGIKLIKKDNWIFNTKNYRKVKSFFKEYGDKAVFIARFSGPLSWVTPFVAGMSKMNFKTYLKYNIPAAILGIGQFLVLGYFLSNSYQKFLPVLEKYSVIFFILFVILILTYPYIRRLFISIFKRIKIFFENFILDKYLNHILFYSTLIIIIIIILIYIFEILI